MAHWSSSRDHRPYHTTHACHLNTYHKLYFRHNLSLKGGTVQAARTQLLYQLPWYKYTCTSQTLSLCVLGLFIDLFSLTSAQRYKSYAFSRSLFCLVTSVMNQYIEILYSTIVRIITYHYSQNCSYNKYQVHVHVWFMWHKWGNTSPNPPLY